jgi:UrcA family protein
MSHFLKLALLGASSLAATLSFGTANASTTDDPPTMVVKYSAQDLATQRGLNDLYHRLVLAAKRVCPEVPFHDLSLQARVAQCQDQAVARAIRQIDNAQLAALYAAAHSKNG